MIRRLGDLKHTLVRPRPYSVLRPDPAPQVFVQGFSTPHCEHKVLQVNKLEAPSAANVPGAAHRTLELADQAIAASATKRPMNTDTLKLPPLRSQW
jgi:hypothetical protein